MDLVRVASFNPTHNISSLSLYLLEQNIRHEIVEDQSAQHLFVAQDRAEQVAAFIQQLQTVSPSQAKSAFAGSGPWWQRALRVWPITFIAIGLGIVGFLIERFDSHREIIHYLLFTDMTYTAFSVTQASFAQSYLVEGQWWRLITPTFLHFGLFHIVMNGLLTWELGRRLEFILGSWTYLGFFAVLAIVSNVVQYAASGYANFGGLSGVVYGFIGLIAIFYRRLPHPLLKLPVGLYVFVGISLLAGLLGLFEAVFGIALANGAHLGGLIAGLFLAAVWPVKAMRGQRGSEEF